MRPTTNVVVALLLAAVLGRAGGAQSAARDAYLTTSDGAKLHYRISGSGPDTVFLLHGGPGFDLGYLEPDFAPLASHHVLVLYDQRGSGLSTITRDSTRLTAKQFVADLDELRAQLHVDRAILLGHSWGGGLAGLYAFEHPQHVARLILVDPMPARVTPWLEVFGRTLSARRDSATRSALRAAAARRDAASDADYPRECRAYLALFVLSYLADPASLQRIRGDLCASPVPALRNQSVVNGAVIASLGQFDWRPDVAKLTMPILVVHGEFDPIPVASGQEWAAAAPNARLALVRMAGHFSYAERPEVFFPIVEAFLAGRWPPGSVHP